MSNSRTRKLWKPKQTLKVSDMLNFSFKIEDNITNDKL